MGKHEDNEAFVRWLQDVAGVHVDGWAGSNTRKAVERLLTVPEASTNAFSPSAFFANIKSQLFGGVMTQAQVDGINAILDGMRGLPVAHVAYALATAYHEVDKTMQPIAEYGKGKGRAYGKAGRNGGQVAYGRGFVQLTWDENYERMDRELGLNGALIANYDLALRLDIATKVMRYGMENGRFTGKKLSDYLPSNRTATRSEFVPARRIINSLDKADLIAGYAMAWQSGLQAGGWK